MTILLALALSASTPIHASTPLHAEEGLIVTSTRRLKQIKEDAEVICPKVIDPDADVASVLEEETNNRAYSLDEKILLGTMCVLYVQGRIDRQ